jgi:hypothetical protein
VFHLVVVDSLRQVIATPSFEIAGSPVLGKVLTLTVWYCVSFFPNLILGYLYIRRDAQVGRFKSMLYAHALIPYNYIAYLATWSAVVRIVLRRNSWSKTSRSEELSFEPQPVGVTR